MEATKHKIEPIDEFSLRFEGEDHTMMNPLRWAISNNWVGDNVDFCGYTIPHPSETASHLNVQFADINQQKTRNVLKKVYEGLECIEVIAQKLLDSVKEAENTQ